MYGTGAHVKKSGASSSSLTWGSTYKCLLTMEKVEQDLKTGKLFTLQTLKPIGITFWSQPHKFAKWEKVTYT